MDFAQRIAWMAFLAASIIARGAVPALPSYGTILSAISDTTFSLACLFANPQAVLASLSRKPLPAPPPKEPT